MPLNVQSIDKPKTWVIVLALLFVQVTCPHMATLGYYDVHVASTMMCMSPPHA